MNGLQFFETVIYIHLFMFRLVAVCILILFIAFYPLVVSQSRYTGCSITFLGS